MNEYADIDKLHTTEMTTIIQKLCYFGIFIQLLSPVYSYGLNIPSIKRRISTILLTSSFLISNVGASEASAKLINLEPSAMAKIVAADITDRQALITADFTRDMYSEKCTFQDEIDTYPIDKYVSGTKALFNKDKSHVDLVGEVTVTEESADFRFSEILAFNIPFNPRVSLTGRVKLSRGSDGLITSSREFWDQSVPAVLSTVKF